MRGETAVGGEWSAATDMDSQHFGQNGGFEDPIRTSPFYAYYKESTNKTNVMENARRKPSAQADVDSILVPPLEFLNSPQDVGYGIKTTENGVKLSEHLNMPQAYDPKDELFLPSSPSLGATANGDAHEMALKNTNLAQTQRFPKPKLRSDSDILRDALFRSSNRGDLSGKSFEEKFDLFSSSTHTVDPFPSPLPRNSFNVSSLDDPFSPTPSKQYDHLQDVFSCVNEGKDIFEITPFKTTFSRPSTNSPSEFKLDTPASTDLFKKRPPKIPPVVPPKPPNKPRDLLTTPQGSKVDILWPTSFSQASSVSSSPSFSPADMNHVQTFKRPPRPLPRTRHPKPEKPSKPETPPPSVLYTALEPEVPEPHVAVPEVTKPPPKPVFKPFHKPVLPRKPKKPESKPLEPENYVVFEDILLIGQEQCVEDWPEDSPELDPDFKPSGKLRLRRESLKLKMESDGGSSEDPDGTFGHNKKKTKKLRMSLLSRRSSKDKYSDDTIEGKSNTLPTRGKSSKEFGSNGHISTGDDEDYSLDYKKKTPETKVGHMFRRASIASSTYEEDMNGHSSKVRDSGKSSKRKNFILRRQSEGSVLDEGDYEEAVKSGRGQRRNNKVKVKFVPQRGFAISLKKPNDEPKGAYGYTPRKGSKDKSHDEVSGARGYTPRDKQDEGFEDFKEIEAIKEMEALSLHSTEATIMHEEQQQKSHGYSQSLYGDDNDGAKEHKHKKSKHKLSLPHKPKAAHGPSEASRTSSPSWDSDDDEMTEKDLKRPEEEYEDDPDETEILKMKKQFKFKAPKKHKHKSKKAKNQMEGASDEHFSEAAKAAWAAAQMDERALGGAEEEEDEEEGDTDSLMEWWYTVEKWDELPSDEEDAALKEDEAKSFSILADKVEHGMRLFNKVFTEQAEILWGSIVSLHTLADDVNEFHHKAKIAGIGGGTTTAVGTVTAITGLALAPITFGASLVVAAVGVGVATAGGIASASAAISDNVNNKNDRKKIEAVLQEYEERLLEISKILHFINQGLYRLRGTSSPQGPPPLTTISQSSSIPFHL
ncbi:hypothetical protein CRENBAI_001179 [Crenichthys baileyi]|uniref:Uncharacterized protein n=1 Tax=Crenichthys baileyi TaxID=28760 RepID=A0AAV9R8A8_9TELE